MSWSLKQKDRLTSLHPDISETMIHKRLLRKFGCDLEIYIRSRFIDPYSTEDYINSMEDITTRTKIGRNWYKPPIDNNTSFKMILRPNKAQDRVPLKCHKCGSTLHLANTCTKKTRINEIKLEKSQETKESNEVTVQKSSSEPLKEEDLPEELSIEKINVLFEVTDVHTQLPKYSD
ncbi:hypothetical protein O181_010578 [Austropuccinia psidii MF-1]|uniref:CCHC-type domain-containing protein n=1 Tax=Austropuccinia psidii MF-1 TaxID=1389203 RepID=A0A9Q3BTL7_9BASI|nr:hypothetical protein [Austropuccinia psidii MF-1]